MTDIPANGPKNQIQGCNVSENSKTVSDSNVITASAPKAPRNPDTSPKITNSISCTKIILFRLQPKVLKTAASRFLSFTDKCTEAMSTRIPQNKMRIVIASNAFVI